MKTIYLDNAATTFPKPIEVIDMVHDCLNNYVTNPRRGSNSLVKRANEQLDLTRFTLAKFLGAKPEQLVFVPSATYGINIVMKGLNLCNGETLYISPYEHNAVVRCAENLKKEKGIQIRILPIERNGELNIPEAKRWFEFQPPKLVVTVHASNVTGDILPIKDIINLVHEYGGKILIDAAQTVGLHTPKLDEYNYDFLSFSSHKGIYGIPGSGVLVIKDGAETLEPLIYGGTGINSEDINMPITLPERFEAGTQALPAIISMMSGIRWLENTGIDKIRNKIDQLKQHLIDGISFFGIKIIGQESIYGNIGLVSFIITDISPQEVNKVLDDEGICVRSGLHCAPLAHKTLGTFPNGTVRVSPAYFNTEEDIEKLLQVTKNLSY